MLPVQSQEDLAAQAVKAEEDRALIVAQLLDGANVIQQTAHQLHQEILTATNRITSTLLAGGKIMLCGNGGSAADAQHIAAELVGRYRRERGAWPALAMTTEARRFSLPLATIMRTRKFSPGKFQLWVARAMC
ncbi:MAG: SIS domain-containing protein [Pyrinomonadaceae bacterium]